MPSGPDPNPGTTPLGLPAAAIPGGQSTIEVVTGGKSGAPIVVASDALLAQIEALRRLAESLNRSAGELGGIIERDSDVASIAVEIPFAALEARRVMHAALGELRSAQTRASNIHDGVVRAQQAYSSGEQLVVRALHTVNEQVAWGLGQAVRILALPLAIGVGEGLLATCLVFRMSPAELAQHAQVFIKAHPRILTNPVTVNLIREAAADVDGFSMGLIGLPLPVADALEKSGVVGVKSSAAEVVAGGEVFGLFKESPGVSVRKTTGWTYQGPPGSLADRVAAFPDPHVDGAGEQVRIDRYVIPGQPDRFDVYIAGTVTFDPKTATQPFDFTSDMRGVAGQAPASAHAVEEAMAGAGVTSSTPVVLNGYSQGGLVASMVAASGHYDVKGVVTFGAPSGQVQLPASVPVLSVRNSEDLVPATSGYDVNPHAVVVERSAFANQAISTDWAVPGHRLSVYQQTAAVVDVSDSPQVRAVLDPLNSFGTGSTHIDSSLWVAERTPTDTIDTGETVPTDAKLTAEGAVAR